MFEILNLVELAWKVAGLLTALSRLVRSGRLTNLAYRFAPVAKRDTGLNVLRVRRSLLRLLLRDQDWKGLHRGEFGRHRDLSHAHRWQTLGSREIPDLKPRMFMTYWPVVVLNKHKLAKSNVRLAFAAMAKLLEKYKKIPMFTGELGEKPGIPAAMKWNYRHTMNAALSLSELDRNNKHTLSVISMLLDASSGWQQGSGEYAGGWWGTSDKKGTPDLWACAFALELLLLGCAGPDDHRTAEIRFAAVPRIRDTLKYLRKEWDERRWGIGNVLLPEESMVLMFIQLNPMVAESPGRDGRPSLCRLSELDPESHEFLSVLLNEVSSTMNSFNTQLGMLKESYVDLMGKQDPPIHPEQLAARLAYAQWLAGGVNWANLFDSAVNGNLGRMFSTELSFLIELTYHYGTRNTPDNLPNPKAIAAS